jgi:GTP-binding protein
LLARTDGRRTEFRVQKVLGFQGLKRFELAEGRAGDICAVTGMTELTVGDTLTSIESPNILVPLTVDAPTMSMDFLANDGPFAGLDGKYVTSRNLHDRLYREVKSNIALVVEDTERAGVFKVSGRGELHLAILIETMRREGFELCVSQPRVIMKTGPDGEQLEPFEDVVIDLEEAFSGPVIEELGRRLGQMNEMAPSGQGRVRMTYRIPARGLIGYRSQFLTDTRGTGTMYSRLAEYAPFAGAMRSRSAGVLISQDRGTSNAYALFQLQNRGTLFIGTQVEVYGGMIVGEHSRANDLVVNPCRAKKLNNIRTHSHDEKLLLTPPRELSLEAALEFINADELVEVTPKSLRMRKALLDHNERKRLEKAAK